MSEGTQFNRRTMGDNHEHDGDDKSGYLPAVELPGDLPAGAIGIAEMADTFGVTHRTLHFYEEKGLLKAGRMGLMRTYDREQVVRMAIINACRETGMPVAVIQELMEQLKKASSAEEADQIFLDFLEMRRRELKADQSNVLRQINQLGTLIEQLSDGEEINDNFSPDALTKLELQCISLIAEGYSSTRLSHALETTPQEVSDLECSIILKLGTKNRFQAVAKAIMLGIVDS